MPFSFPIISVDIADGHGRSFTRYQAFSTPIQRFSGLMHWFLSTTRVIGLTLFLVVSLCAADAGADAWRAWLEQPVAKRLEQLDEQARAAQKAGNHWLAAWCTTLARPAGPERLALIDRLAKMPAPGNAAAYLVLERARCWIAMGHIKEAIDAANEERLRDRISPRLRFDACLVLAVALEAGNRADESAAVRREAADLAKRELYADAGVDLAALRPAKNKTTVDDVPSRFAQAERKRNAGQYAEAETLYRSIITEVPDNRLAAASLVGLGWCRIGLNDEVGGLACWSGLIDEKPRSDRDRRRTPPDPAAADPAAVKPDAGPRGPFRGQALLALVEHAINHRTDPVTGQRWLDRLDGILADGTPTDPSWDAIPRTARLNRIILHLAFDREAKAIAVAKELSADPHGEDAARIDDGNQYTPARGAMRLAQRLAAEEPLTPAQALIGGSPANNVRIVLADAWAVMEQRDQAKKLWAPLLTDQARLKPDQRAYVRMRTAEAEREDGQLDYFRLGFTQLLADQPNNPWAPRLRLCLAIDDIGRRNDPTGGLNGFRSIIDHYPTSDQARTACWYTGMVQLFHGHWNEADQAWAELDQRWPNHPWRAVINDTYRPMLREAQRTGIWPAALPRAQGASQPTPAPKPRTP